MWLKSNWLRSWTFLADSGSIHISRVLNRQMTAKLILWIIWYHRSVWINIKTKPWKFEVIWQSRSKYISLSFSVKVLLFLCFPYSASFSCKHHFLKLFWERTKKSLYLKFSQATHFGMDYLLNKKLIPNSKFEFWDDVKLIAQSVSRRVYYYMFFFYKHNSHKHCVAHQLCWF